MAVTYKVWVCVERHDDRTDEYRDEDLPFSAVAEFAGRGAAKAAHALAERVHEAGVELAGDNGIQPRQVVADLDDFSALLVAFVRAEPKDRDPRWQFTFANDDQGVTVGVLFENGESPPEVTRTLAYPFHAQAFLDALNWATDEVGKYLK